MEGGDTMINLVTFPDFSSIADDNATIGNFMSLPNNSYPFFWAWILGGLWIIIALTLYFKEKEKIGRGNLLSSMAISSFAIIILSTLGTIVGFVTLEIFIPLLVLGFLIIGVWFFSR